MCLSRSRQLELSIPAEYLDICRCFEAKAMCISERVILFLSFLSFYFLSVLLLQYCSGRYILEFWYVVFLSMDFVYLGK